MPDSAYDKIAKKRAAGPSAYEQIAEARERSRGAAHRRNRDEADAANAIKRAEGERQLAEPDPLEVALRGPARPDVDEWGRATSSDARRRQEVRWDEQASAAERATAGRAEMAALEREAEAAAKAEGWTFPANRSPEMVREFVNLRRRSMAEKAAENPTATRAFRVIDSALSGVTANNGKGLLSSLTGGASDYAREVGQAQAAEDSTLARVLTDALPAGVGMAVPIGVASKGLQGLGVAPRVANAAAGITYGGASAEPGHRLEGAVSMGALIGLGGTFSKRIAEYLPKLPLNLRPIVSEGGGNFLAGLLLGQDSPDEVVTNLVLGSVMRAMDTRPDLTQADLRRVAIEAVRERATSDPQAPRATAKPAPEITPEQAGEVKAGLLDSGIVSKAEAISPELEAAAVEAQRAGLTPEQTLGVVKALGGTVRADGNVADGFKPTEEVLNDPQVPEAQKAAVREAQAQGIATVTSHVNDDGTAMAAGVDAQGNLRRVDVPADTPPAPKALAGMRGVTALSDELGAALDAYGPRPGAPEDGVRLGAGLGGVSPKVALAAADAPRDILTAPGRLLNRPVERGIDLLGKVVGKAVRKIPGVNRLTEAWNTRRDIQRGFAQQGRELEAAQLEGDAALQQIAKATPTPERQAAVQDYIENPNSLPHRAAAMRSIGEDGMKAVDEALDIRDRNQRTIEQAGLVGEEAVRVYSAKEGERGTYLRREYAGVEDEVLDTLLRLSGRGSKIPANELKRDKWAVTWGKQQYRKFETQAEAEAFAKEQIATARADVEVSKANAPTGKRGAASPIGKVEVLPPLSAEARKSLGEVRDPAVVLARTIAVQDLRIARHRLLEQFANGRLALPATTKATDLPPTFSSEPLPNDRAYGALAGKYVDARLRAEIVGRFGAREPLDKFFDIMERGSSLWKMGKTIYNPGSHGNNVFGNLPMAELAGVSLTRPSDYPHLVAAFRVAMARPGTKEYALRVEFARRGIGSAGSIDAELQGALLRAVSVRGLGRHGAARQLLNTLARAPKRAWELEDTIPKMWAAMKALREGKGLDGAQKIVADSFTDYSTSWVGLIVNSRTRTSRAIKATIAPPFVQFLSEAVRIAAGAVHKKSASLATGIAVLYAVGEMTRRMAGIDDDEKKKIQALAPKWMRPGSLAAPFLWDRDAQGNAQTIDLRYALPLAKEISDLTGSDDARQSQLGLINNPLLAPLIDIFGGKDRFTGEDLAGKGASDGERTEQALRYLWDAYAPSLATKFLPFGRRTATSHQALTGTPDRYGVVPDVAQTLAGDLAGVRIRKMDTKVFAEKARRSVMARLAAKDEAIRAARRRGDSDEVAAILKDIAALREEYRAIREAAGR